MCLVTVLSLGTNPTRPGSAQLETQEGGLARDLLQAPRAEPSVPLKARSLQAIAEELAFPKAKRALTPAPRRHNVLDLSREPRKHAPTHGWLSDPLRPDTPSGSGVCWVQRVPPAP